MTHPSYLLRIRDTLTDAYGALLCTFQKCVYWPTHREGWRVRGGKIRKTNTYTCIRCCKERTVSSRNADLFTRYHSVSWDNKAYPCYYGRIQPKMVAKTARIKGA
jgi:hypothetical protein